MTETPASDVQAASATGESAAEDEVLSSGDGILEKPASSVVDGYATKRGSRKRFFYYVLERDGTRDQREGNQSSHSALPWNMDCGQEGKGAAGRPGFVVGIW
jgi:hypothetical protein